MSEHRSYFKTPKTKGKVPPEIYEEVMNRDGGCRAYSTGFATDIRCQGRIHAHHRILRSQGGQHTVDNLIMLCDLHHQHVHNIRRAEAEECGLIIRQSSKL